MAKYSKKQIIEAIKNSRGVISVIARRLGASWITVKKAIDNDEELLALWKAEREAILDLCEETIITSVENGDVGTAKWVLNVMGGARGWNEKYSINLGDKQKITIEFIDKKDHEDSGGV